MPNGDDHDMLIRVDSKLDHVVEKVDTIANQQGAQWAKIDKNTTQITRWKAAIAVIGVAVTAAWAFLLSIGGI